MSHMVLTPQTELEAVNALLTSIEESPVSSLTTTTTTDVNLAKTKLSEINRRVQKEGWHFNTDYDVTLSLDGSSTAGGALAVSQRSCPC